MRRCGCVCANTGYSDLDVVIWAGLGVVVGRRMVIGVWGGRLGLAGLRVVGRRFVVCGGVALLLIVCYHWCITVGGGVDHASDAEEARPGSEVR